jgi:hypothetical protein
MADLINRDLTQYVDDDQPVWLDIAALRNERWGAWCSGATAGLIFGAVITFLVVLVG